MCSFSPCSRCRCQVLGVHQLTYTSPSGKPSTENVVVMENLFHNAQITRIFDLKGKVRFCPVMMF